MVLLKRRLIIFLITPVFLDRANAAAVFQLLFTDVDLAAIPTNVSPNILLFTTIGMVDTQFQPKPALAIWDNVFARPLK
ncbi:MAG: hypothetical protein LW841_11380 [Flammeovirgaceae bacterium]|nr:hypothetical protein [Flammeovirgaceae bacterium]MCZ8072057.1 hypothetical protein [Cytophagales bacterium]